MDGERLEGADRAEYARVLDEALHTEEIQAALRRMPGGPNSEQMRTGALGAAHAIASTAAREYARYAALRSAASAGPAAPDGPSPSSGPAGPGLFATSAVLVPMLSGVAAAVFLALGYGLRAVRRGPAVGTPLIGIGYVAAGVFCAGLAVGLVGLVLTARRDSAATRTSREVAEARTVWRRALLVRGVLPYLRQYLAEAETEAEPAAARISARSVVSEPPRDVPGSDPQRNRLGSTGPGFGSPRDKGL